MKAPPEVPVWAFRGKESESAWKVQGRVDHFKCECRDEGPTS